MTSKNALGSMPCAETKSVPVFLSDCIAALMPCTAATQDTSEKTVTQDDSVQFSINHRTTRTNDLSAKALGLTASK